MGTSLWAGAMGTIFVFLEYVKNSNQHFSLDQELELEYLKYYELSIMFQTSIRLF